MKNKSKADKKTILKRVAAGGLFFTVFSLSAGSAFLLFPQATIVQREESPEGDRTRTIHLQFDEFGDQRPFHHREQTVV